MYAVKKNKIFIVELIFVTLTENVFAVIQDIQGQFGISKLLEGNISIQEMA